VSRTRVGDVAVSRGVQARSEGIVDHRKAAIRIERLGKVAGALQIGRRGNEGGGWGPLPQGLVPAEEEDLFRPPDRTRKVPTILVALKNRLRQAGAVVGPRVGVKPGVAKEVEDRSVELRAATLGDHA